jgi:2-polyprenyl-3-methyl-5-hydroxy-6-metoxy-1,4-benzoquinol methylase
MEFDIVVAIEIIEHIKDYEKFLETIIKKFSKKDKEGNVRTHWFISSPNRNNKNILDDGPNNKYHVREWTQEEFREVLLKYFTDIEFLNSKGETVGDKKDHTPLLAHCKTPK